ncbi:hypothetical protein PR048_021268 [Dryococelus australis]|uniref:Uncharacterized protein n=1 Tax=Dryococelus australis TaxID=614101 RepID=A0ABQ9GXS5_9NEOP|nr:hypothetical protein PR048_021268 [Dryococelus australis]
MEQCRGARAGVTGDPRENPPTSGIVRCDSCLRKSGCGLAGDLNWFALVVFVSLRQYLQGSGLACTEWGGAVVTHWTRVREDLGSIPGSVILISVFRVSRNHSGRMLRWVFNNGHGLFLQFLPQPDILPSLMTSLSTRDAKLNYLPTYLIWRAVSSRWLLVHQTLQLLFQGLLVHQTLQLLLKWVLVHQTLQLLLRWLLVHQTFQLLLQWVLVHKLFIYFSRGCLSIKLSSFFSSGCWSIKLFIYFSRGCLSIKLSSFFSSGCWSIKLFSHFSRGCLSIKLFSFFFGGCWSVKLFSFFSSGCWSIKLSSFFSSGCWSIKLFSLFANGPCISMGYYSNPPNLRKQKTTKEVVRKSIYTSSLPDADESSSENTSEDISTRDDSSDLSVCNVSVPGCKVAECIFCSGRFSDVRGKDSSETDLLTNFQCDNRTEHLPRRRHRGANPRPSDYKSPTLPLSCEGRAPLHHDDNTRTRVNISVFKDGFSRPSSYLAVETMLKRTRPTGWQLRNLKKKSNVKEISSRCSDATTVNMVRVPAGVKHGFSCVGNLADVAIGWRYSRIQFRRPSCLNSLAARHFRLTAPATYRDSDGAVRPLAGTSPARDESYERRYCSGSQPAGAVAWTQDPCSTELQTIRPSSADKQSASY